MECVNLSFMLGGGNRNRLFAEFQTGPGNDVVIVLSLANVSEYSVLFVREIRLYIKNLVIYCGIRGNFVAPVSWLLFSFALQEC